MGPMARHEDGGGRVGSALFLLLFAACGRPSSPLGSPFEPPADAVADDPSLAPGVLLVTIDDAYDKPLAGAPVAVRIQRELDAKTTDEKLERAADASGSLRLGELGFGPRVTYSVSTRRGDGRYFVEPFSLSATAGKRVTLHAYETTSSLERVLVGIKGEVRVTALPGGPARVEQDYEVVNLDAVAWAPKDVSFALPRGATGFESKQSGDEARAELAPDGRVALRGTFAPGKRRLGFRYRLPADGGASASIHFEAPPGLVELIVLLEAGEGATMTVTGFPGAQTKVGEDGVSRLGVIAKAAPGQNGLGPVDVLLTLPPR